MRLVLRRVKVDLLFASSGIEPEIIASASDVEVLSVGPLPVARGEDLLATKVLSMTERRLQDRLDAQNILRFRKELDIESVRARLDLITQRGFHRKEDLDAKLESLLAAR